MLVSLLADACNPAVPGCHPETSSGSGLALGIVVLVALAAVIAGVVVLVVLLLRRRRPRGGAPIQPGWFPDPYGRSRWRWWDGVRWTDQVNEGDAPLPDLGSPG